MDGGDWHQDVEDYSHKIATLTTSFITRSDSDEKNCSIHLVLRGWMRLKAAQQTSSLVMMIIMLLLIMMTMIGKQWYKKSCSHHWQKPTPPALRGFRCLLPLRPTEQRYLSTNSPLSSHPTCSVGDLADPPILMRTLLPPPVSFFVITISESSTVPSPGGCFNLFLWPALGRVLLPCNMQIYISKFLSNSHSEKKPTHGIVLPSWTTDQKWGKETFCFAETIQEHHGHLHFPWRPSFCKRVFLLSLLNFWTQSREQMNVCALKLKLKLKWSFSLFTFDIFW